MQNTLHQYPIPEWLPIFFLITIPLPFILIIIFLYKESRKLNHDKSWKVATLFFACYLAYITIASLSGLFNQVFFPPKVLLFTTVPYALLLFMILPKTKAYNSIFEQSKLEDLVALHAFRVIGVFFLFLAFYDALPKPFAIFAGLGDVITAISSFFVVKAIKEMKSYAKKLTIAWNLFGAVDIIITAVGANVLTKISMSTGAMGVDSLAYFPFCIIPAFAPPTILFLHWTIYKKMNQPDLAH